ncbi:MFS general substrate transporter [Jaminaea rosea]|uniref:MFS general substrate transporter n=1 Tax=Jaminaea rosea TaxID=1569628 RepID=A0A316UP00_9BASI|nr:MFS general substrate transporter [Jaminaea rosea]PWN27017.1 MFS general substrate transporter [Jaminaea rosea]
MTLSSKLCALRVALWGPPPASALEARLIRKIDFLVLTFTCLMYWSNYLSRTGFQFAYVSGMSEDLSFQGNDYSIANTLFTVGYVLGMIPNILALQVVSPHYWLPGAAALWAGLAMCLAAAKNPAQVFAIRFLQGLVEASTFAGSHYILGSWYTETEIGKRSGIFASSAQLGSLFSGVIQGGIHTNMDGYRGLRSWQWQFLLDGFIGIPIALYGFIFFPDVPRRARKWLLTEEERKLAIERLPRRQQVKTRMGWSLIKRVLGRWHWYAFSALFAWSSMLESIGSNGLFALWLQAERYPVRDRNYWPLALQAVAISSTIIAAAVTDLPSIPRWTVNPVMAVSLIFTSIVLLIWTVPFGLKFAAFTIGGMGYAGQATNFSWANIVCAGDEQERAVVLASMNMWSSTVQAWWSIVFYPATDAPRFRRGWIAMICIAVVTLSVKAHEQPGFRSTPAVSLHRRSERGCCNIGSIPLRRG